MILVSCGSAKRAYPAPPRELYVGSLFRAASRYAAASGQPWVILSALHGVLDPDGPAVAPYERTIKNLTPPELQLWAASAMVVLGPGPHVSLLGSAYEAPLLAAGMQLERPLRGLRLGERIAWLVQQTNRQQELWT